ncbi:hypothetical protein SGLAM104S_10091 [Streptomyces glaucescens]
MTFALDGKTYEIDLATANADKLRGLLEPYVKGGRRPGAVLRAGAERRGPLPAAARTPRPSAPGRRRTVTRSTTVAAFRRPFARLTRRPTAEHPRAAAGSGGVESPPCPRRVRDRGRPHRPPRPTASAARPRPRTPNRGAAPTRRPPAPSRRRRRPPAARLPPRRGDRRGDRELSGSPLHARPRRLHEGALAEDREVQVQRAPLQPVEQPRQLLCGARGRQQPHPSALCGDRRGRRQMPQRGDPRRGGDVQDVEARAHQEPQRAAGHHGPSQIVLVPPAEPVARVEWPAGTAGVGDGDGRWELRG